MVDVFARGALFWIEYVIWCIRGDDDDDKGDGGGFFRRNVMEMGI